MKMKKLLRFTLEWKISASLIFTGTLFVYLTLCLLTGQSQAPTLLLWGVLGMSVAGALLQALCFSDWVFKKLRYTRRSLLFVLLFLPVLALIAWKTRWFPAGRPEAWLGFIGLFLLIFAAMTIGFEFYFRITGRKYDGLIGQYRRSASASASADRRTPYQPGKEPSSVPDAGSASADGRTPYQPGEKPSSVPDAGSASAGADGHTPYQPDEKPSSVPGAGSAGADGRTPD